MIYTVETKDAASRIFDYLPFSWGFSDEFKAWYEEQGLKVLPMSRGISEVPLILNADTFAFTDDMDNIGENELITNTFYFGDPEVAMLFRLTWS